MLEAVRRTVSRWIQRGSAREALAAEHPLFADHEEIRDIARQLGRSKVELDRTVLTLRSWARDLNRRLDDSPDGVGRSVDLRTLGETVGGLTHNFNNSLAAILAYTELLLKEAPSETAERRLKVIREDEGIDGGVGLGDAAAADPPCDRPPHPLEHRER